MKSGKSDSHAIESLQLEWPTKKPSKLPFSYGIVFRFTHAYPFPLLFERWESAVAALPVPRWVSYSSSPSSPRTFPIHYPWMLDRATRTFVSVKQKLSVSQHESWPLDWKSSRHGSWSTDDVFWKRSRELVSWVMYLVHWPISSEVVCWDADGKWMSLWFLL